MATVGATEFNRNPSQIKRMAADEPVVVTEHDRPSLVVLTYAEYQNLIGAPRDMAEWLAMDDDIDFEADETGWAIEPVTDW